MPTGGGGSGSQLVIRAREAALRAKTAGAIGITPPPNISMSPGGGIVTPPVVSPVQPAMQAAQPPTTTPPDRPNREKMLAEVEGFLGSVDVSFLKQGPGATLGGGA